jgi:predicted AAA+ superfamily ATPase
VITEVVKLSAAFGKRQNLLHFRADENSEVDLVIEQGTRTIPVEIKSSSIPDASWGRGIKAFRKVTKLDSQPAYVISLSHKFEEISEGIFNLPLQIFC